MFNRMSDKHKIRRAKRLHLVYWLTCETTSAMQPAGQDLVRCAALRRLLNHIRNMEV